jgi:hypothetical protein
VITISSSCTPTRLILTVATGFVNHKPLTGKKFGKLHVTYIGLHMTYLIYSNGRRSYYYIQVPSSTVSIGGQLLVEHGANSFGQWQAKWKKCSASAALCAGTMHVYKTVCTPFLGEILTTIPEPENNHNRHAVCIKKGTKIVGHVSSTGVPLALLFASFTLKFSFLHFHVSV